MDSRGLKSGKMILSFVQPFCYIPLLESRCRSVQHLCQKLTPPWASLVFPKEKEVTRTATFAAQIAACHRGKEVSGIANKCKHDLFLILFDCFPSGRAPHCPSKLLFAHSSSICISLILCSG
ncbi:hypothetical protein CHARACLAT_030276 [Characodon lateralis]|uniref:Uncharacterized protein n=1 Tax=Characodon lateralis TaxID=208331 RepID=A0ABU7DDW1_9TELE|nr:hypothetical protein [Characodon lateralis]